MPAKKDREGALGQVITTQRVCLANLHSSARSAIQGRKTLWNYITAGSPFEIQQKHTIKMIITPLE